MELDVKEIFRHSAEKAREISAEFDRLVTIEKKLQKEVEKLQNNILDINQAQQWAVNQSKTGIALKILGDKRSDLEETIEIFNNCLLEKK